jgi:hypothetical protein
MNGDPENEDDRTRVMPGRLQDEGLMRREGDFDDVATHMVGKRANNPVARLLVIEGPGIGNGRPIYPGTNSIGRDLRNRIALDYGDDSISRIGHAVIVAGKDGSGMSIIDGGKVNAIHLNSVMVTGERALGIGDVIEIGLTLLRVEAI